MTIDTAKKKYLNNTIRTYYASRNTLLEIIINTVSFFGKKISRIRVTIDKPLESQIEENYYYKSYYGLQSIKRGGPHTGVSLCQHLIYSTIDKNIGFFLFCFQCCLCLLSAIAKSYPNWLLTEIAGIHPKQFLMG